MPFESYRRHKLILAASTLALGFGTAEARQYIVKSGDSLSVIAHRYLPGPVWGKDGSLNQLMAMNADSIKSKDLIFPGQSITISQEAPEQRQASTEEPTPNHETAELQREPAAEAAKPAEQKPAEPVKEESKTSPSNWSDSAFGVEAGFFATQISATQNSNGTQAKLLSTSNLRGNLSYLQRWSPDWETSIYFGMENLSLNQPLSGGQIDNSSTTLYHFGLGSDWRLSSKLSLGATLGLEQQPFLVGVNATTVHLDAVYVPRLQAHSSLVFFEKRSLAMGGAAALGISAPTSASSYQSQWNPNFQAALFLQHQANSWLTLETGAKVSDEIQNTSLVNQSQIDLGIYLKAMFRPGGL